MAEVDALSARTAPAVPITTLAFGKLHGLTAEHRPVAATGGLIDAFAEVFASMSRRSEAIDPSFGQRFGQNQGNRDSSNGAQATSQDDANSNSHASLDSTQDRPQLNRTRGDDEADDVDATASSGAGSDVAAHLEQAIGAVRNGPEAEPESQRQRAATTQAESAHEIRGEESAGQGQSHQQLDSARQMAAADGSASSLEESNLHESPAVVEDTSGDSDDRSTLQAASRLAKRTASRGQDITSAEEIGSAAKTSSQVARSVLQPTANSASLAAEAVELSSQGMTPSTGSSTAGMTPLATAAIGQLQGLAPLPPGAESISGLRTTAKGWNQTVDFSQPLGPDASRSGTASNRSTETTSDVVARIKLIQRVSKAFQHLGPEGGTVRIRLAPAELGSVRVEMQVHDRQVKARVIAETEAATNALREHLPELRARLESFGMQVERLEVEAETSDSGFDARHQADSDWQSSQQQQRSANRLAATTSRSHRVESDPPALIPSTTTAVLEAAKRGVDVRL